MNDIEVVRHTPRFTREEAEDIGRKLFGVNGRAESLPGERDQNFRLVSASGPDLVLKIANGTERRDVLDFQNAILRHLETKSTSLALPRVRSALDGSRIASLAAADGTEHMARLLTWVAGRVLANVRPHTRALLESLGSAVAEMDQALEDFEHPAMDRPLPWDLARFEWVARELERHEDAERRLLVERVVAGFEQRVLPRVASLRRQVVHNDWNDYNAIVGGEIPDGQRVTGVVDFGDAVHSFTLADLAVAACYAMLDKPDPVAAAAVIAGGFHRRVPLTEQEMDLLLDFVRMRLAISVTMAVRQAAAAPGNAYLRISEAPAWRLLARLDAIDRTWSTAVIRHACGLSASPTSAAVRAWLHQHAADFAAVVDTDLRREPVAVLDLSIGSPDISSPDVVCQVDRFSAWVDAQVARKSARAGIGRYNEARLIYVTDLFRHPGNWDEENRTVHLGIDVFLPEGSRVHAPLAGRVHSLANNAANGDYGPTVVLEHEADGGLPFYTLYGHLSEDSLAGLAVGLSVRRGQTLGRLGSASVNGGWPPHLHFQVITDMLGRQGDFPGVAAPRERDVWLSLCPDANLVLGIPDDRFLPPEDEADTILGVRRRHFGRNLSVSYRRPLAMVRGHMQFLFDQQGRRYLDAVNNVPHVGHSHPRVVEAVARQMAVLNTNTRYLSPLLTAYVERLASLMPPPLDVCFLVSSGSEANELALRLAQCFTGGTDLIVVDGAYHGNTTSLVAMSPYKFNGPGGAGRPDHVRVVPMPDVYRGLYRGTDQGAGARYAAHVTAACDEVEAAGRRLSAFFCESVLSCGGQIVLPDGFLSAAYAAVRQAGGVTVADEVQVGFGRVGTHLWAFETQGVVPDIVTLGKPIGNGFPLGAVITRAEIADAFANGMEYFNTFGGGQAACAAGMAVLDVMRDDGLQERARTVGTRLKSGLESLADTFDVIGDVRGLGLFVGLELVLDRRTLEPAAEQAEYVVNRLRDRGILTSTDGPLHNIIKMKPPLAFTTADVDRLVSVFAEVLSEDAARV